MNLALRIGILLALAAPCRSDDSAIPKLEAATRDPDRGVRFAAVEALGKAGAGIEAIANALDDPEWCVRAVARRALSNIGEPALPRIERLYKKGNPRTRIAAIEAGRRIGAKGAAVVITALDDEDAAVRREAADGVALIGEVKWSEEQIARLKKLAESVHIDDKLNACFALGQIGEQGRALVKPHMDDLRAMIQQGTPQHRWLDHLEAWLKEPEPPEPPRIDLEKLASATPAQRAQELDKIRLTGVNFKQHEQEIAKLLGSKEPGVARDAALALELIGADAAARVIRHGPVRAAYACKDPSKAELKSIWNAIGSELTDDDLADWILLLGRLRVKGDENAEACFRETAKRSHDRLRANSVWALGEIGIGVPEALGDRSLAVREIALPYITSVPRLVSILNGTHREARILAARRLGQLGQHDHLLAVSSHEDPLLRIAVAQALGARCPTSYVRDEARDVRIAAASVLRGPELLSLLNDKNWRVRAAAVRSLGHAKLGVDQLALLLGSRDYTIGIEAFESLKRIGSSAAPAVGSAVDNGNEATWHYAPKLFESYGGAGAAGVGALVAALKHPNPTARECAARCIGSVGPDAVSAAPALVEALADRRLGVVAHASLALGRIGITDALLGALADKRARVRAYSAFAIGWALGAKRGFDQAFFESRPPVLDCGEPAPDVTVEVAASLATLPEIEARRIARAGLRSKDKRIAYPCAALLDYDHMNAWECERAVELLVGEGFRDGHPFSFSNFRSYIGSNELPACVQMMCLARECDRDWFFGHFHRSARAENIPALLWFERNEDVKRQEDLGSMWQPFSHSAQYRELRQPKGVWAEIENYRGLWTPERWYLETEPIPESREALLIDVASWKDQRRRDKLDRGHEESALRALGRAPGHASLRYLRWRSAGDDEYSTHALAALARRADPVATVRLVERARADDLARALLLDVRPDLGRALLRALLSDANSAQTVAEEISSSDRHDRSYRGVQWGPLTFLGIEPALPVEVLDREALEAIALGVPGCRTRRVAEAILERVEEGGLPDWEDQELEPAALLDAAFPDRFRKVVRGTRPAVALPMLAVIRDPADAERVAQWVAGGSEESEVADDWRHPTVARALLALKTEDAAERAMRQWGIYFGEEESSPAEEKLLAATRAGNGSEALRRHFSANPLELWRHSHDDVGPRYPWMEEELRRRYDLREVGGFHRTLGELATWDKTARAEYWSIMRAGRYRWLNDWGETHAMTLEFDFATLPHWSEEMESNCCRLNPRIDSMFEKLFEGPGYLYSRHDSGVGQPPSERIRDWFELYGGPMKWSRLVGRFIPEAE